MQKHFYFLTSILLLYSNQHTSAQIIIIENQKEYQQKVIESAQPVVVKYWSSWCYVCKKISQPFEEVSNMPEFKNIVFVEVNAEKSTELLKENNITGLPTIEFLDKGIVVESIRGVSENAKEFKEKLIETIDKAFKKENKNKKRRRNKKINNRNK
jgi:thioredoxin 1